jgi:hypothetical protein
MRHFDLWKLWPFWREIAVAVIAAYTSVWTWLRIRQAHSWPSSQGNILNVRARRAGGSLTQGWAGELNYTYVAEGQYYSGSHLIRARSEGRAEELVLGWKDRMVMVRYSPSKHDVSVLLKSDQPGSQLGN